MIRFMPDTWLDALVRPIGMAVPAGGIYAEILAPDFRFIFVLALVLGWLAWRVRVRSGAAARTLGLLAFVAATFVPWLATSGNGRYFMPSLFIVGPLCIALAHHLPLRQGWRLGLAGLMVLVQVALLHEVQPWSSWGLAPWREGPAFGVDVPQDMREKPATYVTLSSISYSLIAPNFHPDSRWINLSSQNGRPGDSPDQRRARALLSASPVVYGVFPSAQRLAGEVEILPEQADAIDLGLAEYQLRIVRKQCRIVASRGLTAIGARDGQEIADKEPRGFWFCRLEKHTAAPAEQKKAPPDVEAVFDRVEQQCPRLFPPGAARTTVVGSGFRRFYPDADMRLYVMDDGQVMYKYLRALNAVELGTKADVMRDSFHVDCNIRGRAGLPWEREI